MGLTFLQPAFLFGALAAAVPVIIHLIYRRRALVHRFPAVRFLLLADKRTARKFRLAQWLLLALRVLAICLLAFSLARPHLTGSNVQAAALAPPQATVFLVAHDHDLIEEVATRIWHFDHGQISDFKGAYEEYSAACV